MVALLLKARKRSGAGQRFWLLLSSADDLGQPATGRECRVAVRDQGGDQDLAIHLGELQDLQPGCRQPSVLTRLVHRKGGLPVAGTGPELQPVWAGRGEYGGFDECRDGRAAIEPCSQRRHGEPNVLGNQLDEGIDVGQPPGADVPFQELPYARIADGRLRGSTGPRSLPGAGEQTVDRRGADGERLADLGVAEAKHVVGAAGPRADVVPGAAG